MNGLRAAKADLRFAITAILGNGELVAAVGEVGWDGGWRSAGWCGSSGLRAASWRGSGRIMRRRPLTSQPAADPRTGAVLYAADEDAWRT
jgi:hypothetical protein